MVRQLPDTHIPTFLLRIRGATVTALYVVYFFDRFEMTCAPVGRNAVVGIDEGDILTGGAVQTQVAGNRLTGVLLREQHHLAQRILCVLLSILLRDFQTAVRTGIVDEDDFQRFRGCLRDDRINAVRQIIGGIEYGNDDANHWKVES